MTEFLRLAGNEIEDTGSLTDEQKAGKWVKSTNANGDTIYNYYLDNLTSATDLHFVFLKSPTVTYDPNGGKPYEVEREHNTDEAANVYSFKPASGAAEAEAETNTLFIEPYVSHAADGQNDGWKFMGWRLIGDVVGGELTKFDQVNANELGNLILPAEHTIACDYTFAGVNGDTKAQYFKIYDGNVSLTKHIDIDENGENVGVTWFDNSETKAYANVHKGLTMVAQWRWRQAFIPQVYNVTGNSYSDSAEGGTVEITSVTDTSDENYNAAYNENGGKSYHAATGERVNLTATAKEGYGFVGWYDESGNLVATNAEYSYVETQESVKTYYARFKESVTQTYIRQVGSGDSWTDTTNDKIGTLGRYTYTDAVGMPISSTATAGSGYKFMGWYDSEGNKVADNMLINDGTTISYTTTGNATYYARFEKAYTLNVSKIDGDQSTDKNKVPLAGAEFTLYQADENGEQTIVYEGASIKCTAVRTSVTALNAEGTQATAVFTDTLSPDSVYYLAETKAPTGYRLLDAPLKITFDVSGNIALIDGIEKNITENEVNVELANYLTLHMPTSGTPFTGGLFAVTGLSLLTLAAIGLFWFKISRYKSKNK